MLGLEDTTFAGIDAVALVFGVVLFSLVVQGITYKPILDSLGLTGSSDELTRYEALLAETFAMRSAERELEEMRRAGEIVACVYDDIHRDIEAQREAAEAGLAKLARDEHGVRTRQTRLAAPRLAAAQKQALSEAARSGRISESIARDKSKQIDLALQEGEKAQAEGEEPEEPTLFPDEEAKG